MHPERLIDRPREDFRLEWLGAEVVGTERDRLERVGAIVLPREHDHLGVRRKRMDLVQQRESFRRVIRMGRQAEIHGDDRGLVAAEERDRGLAIAGENRFVAVECPAHLFLQRRIVLDDEQRLVLFRHAWALFSVMRSPSTLPQGPLRRRRAATRLGRACRRPVCCRS